MTFVEEKTAHQHSRDAVVSPTVRPPPPVLPHHSIPASYPPSLPTCWAILTLDNRWPFQAREDDTLIPNWNNGAGSGNGGVGIGGGSSSGASVFAAGERADEALSAAEVGAGRRSRRPSAESVPVKREEDKRRYGTST